MSLSAIEKKRRDYQTGHEVGYLFEFEFLVAELLDHVLGLQGDVELLLELLDLLVGLLDVVLELDDLLLEHGDAVVLPLELPDLLLALLLFHHAEVLELHQRVGEPLDLQLQHRLLAVVPRLPGLLSPTVVVLVGAARIVVLLIVVSQAVDLELDLDLLQLLLQCCNLQSASADP